MLTKFFTILKSINIYNIYIIIYKNKNKLLYNLFLLLWISNFYFFIITKKFYKSTYKDFKDYRTLAVNVCLIIFMIFFLKLKYLNNYFDKIIVKIGVEKFKLLDLFFSLFWIVITIITTLYNKRIYLFLFEDLEELEINYKFLIFKIFTLLIFILILFSGFTFINLNFYFLTLIGGAIALGFSVSLQKLVNNYVSGLLILWDKSFKIGDAININGYQGMITQINYRSTVIRNLDCSEILIPNEKFLYEIVQNQSLHFAKGNLRIMIQISYNNDINKVLKILVNSTKDVERVLDNPIPLAYLSSFSINGMDVELSFWIYDAVRGAALVRSEVNINILNNFKKHDIELSYKKNLIKLC